MFKEIIISGLTYTRIESLPDWQRFAEKYDIPNAEIGDPESFPCLVRCELDEDERLVPIWFTAEDIAAMSCALQRV